MMLDYLSELVAMHLGHGPLIQLENVDKETPAKSTTSAPSEDLDVDEDDEDDEEDPRSLKEILSAIKEAGVFSSQKTFLNLYFNKLGSLM